MAKRRRKQPNQAIARRSNALKNQNEGPPVGPSSRIAVHYSEESSTSIPPPSMLAAYNSAVPNAAERILSMAEEQQAHRHSLEQVVIHGDSRRSDHGLYIGGGIIGLSIICGSILVALDKDAQGLLIGVGSIVAALAAFIWGWISRKKEVDRIKSITTPQSGDAPSGPTR